MLNDFKTHIENNFSNLISHPFILACSGGLDSVVLTALCTALGLDFHIAHCNFKLRGADSDADEKFVTELAVKAKKRFHVTHFDTIGYVSRNKVNIQIAARELRYAWFAELMHENDTETLVTAHHADDNLETFLINISRGTGIDGLTGIPTKTATTSRPLLAFSRAEILRYATSENLKWVEDKSNTDVKYLRNKIRHEIVPVLKELHPTFLKNFELTQSRLIDSSAVLDELIATAKTSLFETDGDSIRISIASLSALHPKKFYLHGLLKDYGFTAWADIPRLLDGLSGKEIRSKTHRLVKDRSYLLLEKLEVVVSEIYTIGMGEKKLITPIKLIIEEVEAIKETGNHILYADKDALKYPMTVRKWSKGDYFHPFGMKGKKKLSKYFKDEKIDVIAKEKQWLLCSENSIVWVIGKRADQRFSVTTRTKQIVKFTQIT